MRWWPNVRAALIGLAIMIGLVDGCPIPSAKQREQLSPGANAAIDDVNEVRTAILKPLRPVRRLTNIQQKWNLFRGAGRQRHRMWIEAREGVGEWELLYRVHDDEHDFMADQLAYRRLRGAWNPRGTTGPRGAYPSFVTWIAGEIFDAEPRFTEARVRMEIVRIGPSGGNTPTGEFEFSVTRRRDAVERKRQK
jgi:hypothetical protein